MVDRRSRVPEQLTKSPRNPRIYFNFTLMLFLNRKQYKSGFYRWIHILKSWFVWFWVNLQGKAFPLNKATKTFQIQWQCSPSEYLSLTFWNGSSVTLRYSCLSCFSFLNKCCFSFQCFSFKFSKLWKNVVFEIFFIFTHLLFFLSMGLLRWLKLLD